MNLPKLDTKFKNGWQGIKKCSLCQSEFLSNSGSRKHCDSCKEQYKCNQCNIKLSNNYHKFCSLSCSGKWNQKNNEKVRTLEVNRHFAYIKENIEKRVLKTKGKPNFSIRGDKNPNWKGGTYGSERHKLMGRIEYINWRKSVFERDNYTCQFCNIRGGKLEADHIIPYSVDKSKALDINNGRTLCKSCHKNTDSWGYKVIINYKIKEVG